MSVTLSLISGKAVGIMSRRLVKEIKLNPGIGLGCQMDDGVFFFYCDRD